MSSMEFPPVQTTSFPDSGGVAGSGTQKRSEEKGEGTAEMEVKEKKKEGSPSIKLGLGIEGITAEKPVMKHGKHVFTTAQLDELRLQALIYQYIACGIAVPFHLVMPIWESVASSFGSSSGNGGIYHHYPSLIGARPQGFIYRNMMDPEPGRCRRTDGKKWRCSKNVIPDQKYCEQHMHRGRQRSRKLVESSQSTLSDMKSMKNSNKESDNSQNLSVPVSFQYMKQSSSNISANLEAATATDSNNARSNRSFISCIATTSTMVNSATDKKKNHCKRFKHFPITSEKGEEKLSVSDSSIINRSSKNGNSATVGHSVSSGVGFSPKSVLPVLGCSSSHVCKNDIEAEPGRCRRTDGKKWRCSRDVIPDQKYCARHMHRGAKKHVVVSQLAAIPSVGDCPSSRSTIANKAACAALNTSLSISTPSPHLTTHDEKSSTSNSETTISDTNINV